MKKYILVLLMTLSSLLSYSQVYDTDTTYPLSVDGNKRVMTGFVSPKVGSDADIYAHAFIWVVKNLCQKQHDAFLEINHKTHTFTFSLDVESMLDSKYKNIYHSIVKIKVAEGKLIFYVSGITVQGTGLLKKVTPLEMYKIETKAQHAEIGNDFVGSMSSALNKYFEELSSESLQPIKHWDNIIAKRVSKGMNMDECRLAFGKPQIEMEDGGNIQWMYNSSFYVFFKNNTVDSFVK